MFFVFLLTFIKSFCAADSICYLVSYNGHLIEEKNYEDGTLKSIVTYCLSETKDSVVYDGEIKTFHHDGNKYLPSDSLPFCNYYQDFDKSINDNSVYSLIKSKVLLENVIWSLASIDDEIMQNSAGSLSNRTIKGNASDCSIEYKNLNKQYVLSGIFQTYNSERLQSLKIVIKDGLLIKIFFKGEFTDEMVSFEYSNSVLRREKIYYYKNGNSKPTYLEGYCFNVKGGE
jgi:hypothetical protein